MKVVFNERILLMPRNLPSSKKQAYHQKYINPKLFPKLTHLLVNHIRFIKLNFNYILMIIYFKIYLSLDILQYLQDPCFILTTFAVFPYSLNRILFLIFEEVFLFVCFHLFFLITCSQNLYIEYRGILQILFKH